MYHGRVPICRRCGEPGIHRGDGHECAEALRLAIREAWQAKDARTQARRTPMRRRFKIWGQMPIRRKPARAITPSQYVYPRRWAALMKRGGILRAQWAFRRKRWAATRARGGRQFRRLGELGRPAGGRMLR